MKNLKSSKIILALVVILAVIMGLTFNVNADEIQQINPTDVVNSASNTNSNQNTKSNSNSNASANKNTNGNANTNKNVNTNANKNATSYNNTNTNLPKTGLADYSALFVVIGALAVVAIVAFKKANYYKDI